MTAPELDEPDPRRWFTLAVVVTAVLIAALDTTILNVAIPTILREFHTDLPSLQWVITGYSLTFASLLIIGGRLGDIFGARRMFIIGAALFTLGSFIASISTGVPTLVLGEAIIEGIGASLMLPATLGILSSTFTGHDRGVAFSVWGATAGAAVALGPVLGGWLTTDFSWRWGFRINVIVAPLAIVGAMTLMRPSPPSTRRERIDVPGALLISTGMFLLVFGLSEGGQYGWFRPLQTLVIGGLTVWPASWSLSIVPVSFVLSAILLGAFVAVERRKERDRAAPLFEFSQLNHRGFRYGLATTMVLAMGQLGFLFVLPVFLQDAKHLTALQNGLWLMPAGIFIIIGAQVGGRLTRHMGVTTVVRSGLTLEAIGLLAVALVIEPGLSFWSLMPGFLFFGIGIGFAGSQLVNVVLYEIEPERVGSASGAQTTVRQLGGALGIATIGTVLTLMTIDRASDAVRGLSLGTALRSHALAAIHTSGVSYRPPAGTPAADVDALRRALEESVAAGSRVSMFFATGVVTIGLLLSFLIPTVRLAPKRGETIPKTDDPLDLAAMVAEA
jgi:EmrB/QacA subfamily drug resistance transporter